MDKLIFWYYLRLILAEVSYADGKTNCDAKRIINMNFVVSKNGNIILNHTKFLRAVNVIV